MKNINWKFVAIVLGAAALTAWQLRRGGEHGGGDDQLEIQARRAGPATGTPSLKIENLSTGSFESAVEGYQVSTNLAALPLAKRLFVTNNFIPAANQFLKQFPTRHRPIEAKDIKAVSVNYGVNGYVGVLTRIESDDGIFQIFTQTINGTNHIQCYRDMTDFDVSAPGTVNELKQFPSGSEPSAITTPAQAKAFVAALLQQHNFDFQNYLNPPVAVPYTACPNYGLWEVRYLRKGATSNHEFIGFVIDGTGKNGPYFRWVNQSSTWSLPAVPQHN